MVFRRLRNFLKTVAAETAPPSAQTPQQQSRQNDREAEEMRLMAMFELMSKTRENPPPHVILRPRVPLDGRRADDGWFGGAPRLPAGVVWPQIAGQPARFVAQINLGKLPKETWGGHGPRSGWISLFMPPQWGPAPVVVFSSELGEVLHGSDQGDAEWFKRGRPGETALPRLAEWPIDIVPHNGPFSPPAGYRKGKAPGFPDPRDETEFDLTRPEHQPFNRTSARVLFELLIKDVEQGRRTIEHFRTNPDTGNKLVNKDVLDAFEGEIDTTVKKITLIRNQLLDRSDSEIALSSVSGAMSALAKIIVPQLKVEEATDVEIGGDNRQPVRLIRHARPAHLSGRPISFWDSGYRAALYQQARQAYAAGDRNFTDAQQQWWERVFAFDALHEFGAMGHMPMGEIHHVHGPGTDMEVLLELQTSDLIGWIWGDMYSVVLLIPSNDLRKGNFGRVFATITN